MVSGLERLRAVANSNDEELKLRVLAAFSPKRLEQAELQFVSSIQGSAGVEVREKRSEALATMPLRVSHPLDATEVEADRVAAAVISGARSSIVQVNSETVVSRQGAGEALTAFGQGLLGAEAAGGAELETASGPPGWVVGLVVTVVAATAIGTGYLMSRGRSRTKTQARAEPTTAEPPPPPPPDLCLTAVKILTQSNASS